MEQLWKIKDANKFSWALFKENFHFHNQVESSEASSIHRGQVIAFYGLWVWLIFYRVSRFFNQMNSSEQLSLFHSQ